LNNIASFFLRPEFVSLRALRASLFPPTKLTVAPAFAPELRIGKFDPASILPAATANRSTVLKAQR
jgi:hypothetical protein